jgi:SCF-associated factor 1
MIGKPVQLSLPQDEDGNDTFVTDVQGSFQSFGVFTRSGAVFTSKQDRLMELILGHTADRPLFTTIPALQHKNIIQLAFGDYHFHALHSDGHITSYGSELQVCGALGLGGHGSPDGRLRGIRYSGVGGDGRLIPHAYTEGRRVWFEREKRAWINFLTSGGVDPAEAQERIRMAIGTPGIQCQGEISEWIEQEGRDWESKFGVRSDDDDGLGAYFALSVTAAGWHSGALVLENSELVEKLRRACEIPDPATELFKAEAGSSDSAEDHLPGDGSWSVSSTVATGLDWGRWALGYPPYDAQTIARTAPNDAGATTHMASFKRGQHPINYGASPRVGWLYKVIHLQA